MVTLPCLQAPARPVHVVVTEAGITSAEEAYVLILYDFVGSRAVCVVQYSEDEVRLSSLDIVAYSSIQGAGLADLIAVLVQADTQIVAFSYLALPVMHIQNAINAANFLNFRYVLCCETIITSVDIVFVLHAHLL